MRDTRASRSPIQTASARVRRIARFPSSIFQRPTEAIRIFNPAVTPRAPRRITSGSPNIGIVMDVVRFREHAARARGRALSCLETTKRDDVPRFLAKRRIDAPCRDPRLP